MKPRFGSQALCLGCLVWSALPGAAARAGETFSLLSAVPDDVFFCVAERHNPERQFVTDYWDGVWQAVVQTGLGADLMDLVGSAGGEEQLAEAQRIKDLATQLLGQVDWGQLVGKEFVYAMRMPELVKSDHGMSAGGPDQVWLLAGAEGSGAKNFDGIVGLTNTVLGMAAQAGLPPMKLQMSEKAGARVASLHFPPTQTEGVPSYGLGIAQRGDVIVITLGNRILDEVLGLLSGSGSGKALVASARFKEAFASLPAAEDEVVYFDMQRMLTQLRALTDPIFEAMATAGDSDGADDQPALADQFKNANLKPEADEFVRQAFKAYNRKEYAHALQLTQKAHGLAPNDSVVLYNLACYSAITNKPDEALDWLDKAVDAGFYAPRKISTDPDLAGLRDDPRFEATLAKAKGYAQGDSPESSDGQQWAVVAKTLVERVYGALGVMDHSAAVGYTEGYSERGESVCAMSPGADKLPFYAIACRRPPIKDYAKYLPVETTSCSVNSGNDV
ncbi:MAG: tetratricopeptide repeat protein, partial [Phycisphaerae bacterium]